MRPLRVLAVIALLAIVVFGTRAVGLAEGAADEVDTALILAVDVSQSVDEARYRLQMEGIAGALEDPDVIRAITGGERGGIILALVTWADRARVDLTWQIIRNTADAQRTAALIRALPQQKGEYTCLGRMMEMIGGTVISSLPVRATRIVLDVSGDGIDNCSRRGSSVAQRDQLVGLGVVINGLPIIVKGENDIVGAGAYRAPGIELSGETLGPGGPEQTTLDAWYNDNVIGGPGAFLLPARGFEDFGRAFRQKFFTEISALQPG
jgi:hypothetical protein